MSHHPPLHARWVGDGSVPVVWLHGLFGQGKNFTTVANSLAARLDVANLLVDLPNHGRSGWTAEVNLDAMAEAIADELRDLGRGPVALVGHSLGGRVAMRLALTHGELLRSLVVVDIAPGTAAHTGSQQHFVQAMRALDLEHLSSRSDADYLLAADVPDPAVRGFLLQNLRLVRHPHQHWAWQHHLDVLGDQLSAIGQWPSSGTPFRGPTLWLAGGDSPYVGTEDAALMRSLFPRVLKVSLKGAGHWVHADQPVAFVAALERFLLADGVSPA